MRFRMTVRGDAFELRGYADGEDSVRFVADQMYPHMVIASPADDDFDPFDAEKELKLRELHHYEVEQENERLTMENKKLEAQLAQAQAFLESIRTARANHPPIPVCEYSEPDDIISCGWRSAVADIDAALEGMPT